MEGPTACRSLAPARGSYRRPGTIARLVREWPRDHLRVEGVDMRWLGSSILAGAISWSAVFAAPAPTPPQPAADTGAKTWVGRAAEIEAYLRTAPIVRTEETDRGVTRPIRAFFAPGGAIESMVWKELRPGRAQRLLRELQVRDRRLRNRQAARVEHGAAESRTHGGRQDRRRGDVGDGRPHLFRAARRAQAAAGDGRRNSTASSPARRCSTT